MPPRRKTTPNGVPAESTSQTQPNAAQRKMFDIGFPEFLLAAVVALLVLGPERLPGALRTLGLWIGRLRRGYYNAKTEIEREIGMDEVRRQLHNEQVMADVQRVEQEARALGEDLGGSSTDDAALPTAARNIDTDDAAATRDRSD